MEKLYIKSRIDCPPLETRLALKDKDLIIQKQQDKIKELELNLEQVIKQRDYLLNLFKCVDLDVDIINNRVISNNTTTTKEKHAKIDSSTLTDTNNSTSINYESLSAICDDVDNDDRIRFESESAAASIIQNAYRQYKLKKNYLKICENNVRRRSLDVVLMTSTSTSTTTTTATTTIKKDDDQKLPTTSASNSCSSVNSYFSSTSSTSGSTGCDSTSLQSNQQQQQQQISSSSLIRSTKYDRKFLIGLNLFNHKPEKGIKYLVDMKYLDYDAKQIAEFLLKTKFLSKQIIGEYLSNSHDLFIKLVLNEFCKLINFKNLAVDEALRLFQTHFRMPGEAQKIEYLTHTFSYYYIQDNKDECKRIFKCAEETIDVLAYAIIILNTTIHNPNVKTNEKMKFEQFIKMTKGIDAGHDIDRTYLLKLYDRVKQNEFKADKDHVNIVIDFERNLVNKSKSTSSSSSSLLSLALPYRRLICYVQLYEIYDLTKKEKSNQHQRDVFLFNDLLVVTKVFSKKKSNTLYSYRCAYSLHDMDVYEFKTDYYQYGIRLLRLPEKKVLITFNARNTEDQKLFCKDLSESIAETNEIETLLNKDNNTKSSSSSILKDDFSSCDDHRSSISSSGIGSSCSTRSSTGNLAINNTNNNNNNIMKKETFGIVKSTSINSIHDLTLPSQLIKENRAGSDSSINKLPSETQLKTIKRDNSNDIIEYADEERPKEFERKFNSILHKKSTTNSAKTTNLDYKYFSLSASTTKNNLDKSLRSVFKYVGLYNNNNTSNITYSNQQK